MRSKYRKYVFLSISIVCIVVGSYILLAVGIQKTLQGIDEEKTIQSIQPTMNYTIIHPVIDQAIPVDEFPLSLVRSVVIAISDNQPYFVNEPINYSAIAFVNNTDYVKLIDIIATRSDDNKFDVIKDEMQLPFIINAEKMAHHVIELSPNTNPPFYTIGNLTFSTEQQVSYHIFILGKDNHFIQFTSSASGLYIDSDLTKLQYKTNEAMLEQIEQSKQVVRSQSATNDIVEGLTWVIVAWIPLGVATDILLRLYMDNAKED